MIGRTTVQRAAMVLSALLLGACASHNNPWARHDRFADLKAAANDPARMCDVIVENATDIYLDATFNIEGRQRALGLLSPGQRAEFGVSCHVQRIEAQASSSLGELGGAGSRFRKVARLDVLEPTRLRFTRADQVS